ncbi:MAG: citrate (Si)-synthase, partial [Yaniella sp.]|nr:citrate (Si)-synthase [Yaniella sp.]
MTEKHDGKLTVGDINIDLPRVEAAVGNDGLSIGSVLRDTQAVTYDPGFMNTANAQSAITYIDGDAGIL